MIHLENVYKTFTLERKNKVAAVQGLSLDAAKGEVFGYIGPNGAGKSTTIKLMLDLIRPDSGSITINSLSTADVDSRTMVGYLPENPYLYEYLSASEYLAFAARLSGLGTEVMAERRGLLLEKLKLSQAAKRRISTYSKGMQQRTAIAAALIHDPELVILDEPMSGLDPLGRKLIFDLIGELKGQGKTIFISSHVLTDIERLCDRVGIIVQGCLSFEGVVKDLSGSLDDLFLRVVQTAGMGEVC